MESAIWQYATSRSFDWLQFLQERIRNGSLTIELPNGRRHCIEARERGPEACLRLGSYAVLSRTLRGGSSGFAESYMDGDFDTPDLLALIEFALANKSGLHRAFSGLGPFRRMTGLVRRLRPNTRSRARRNAAHHYDLGNSFYEQWLDPTMSYSSALFEHAGQSLEEAQLAKYRRIAKLLNLHEGDRVLDIGCGWGAFALFVAKEYGVRVTGITLSERQWDYAKRRVFEAGLSDRVTIRFADYRDVHDRFDAIASIEMTEAVGKAYWPLYFQRIHDNLKPGGTAALQTITVADRAFADYRTRTDFIREYILPGSMIASPARLDSASHRAGLLWKEEKSFGPDYAQTLAAWRRRFHEAWPLLKRMSFDERFLRMWDFYLASYQAGFRAGLMDVTQIALKRS